MSGEAVSVWSDRTKNGVSSMSSSYDYLFKIVVLGEGAVGKTAIVTRFSHGFFRTDYKTTIGSQFAVKNIETPSMHGNRLTVKLQIWDVAGQSRFQILRPMYYRGSSGGLLVYDVSRRRTFIVLEEWLDELRKAIGKDIPLVLVANKTDLPDRVVAPSEGREFADAHGMPYVESSAKTGEGILDVFEQLATTLVHNRESASD
ncbi:GTP-binding protein [Candidatus Thorarchaeota archaeon]|nr:MAG: GTP-binding protein [Candidatus Thorarchaeota archaeon]